MRQKGRTGGPDKKVSSTPIKQDINTDFSGLDLCEPFIKIYDKIEFQSNFEV